MKAVFSAVVWLVALSCSTAPAVFAEPHQVAPGTQVRLHIVSGIGTAVSRRWRSVCGGGVGTGFHRQHLADSRGHTRERNHRTMWRRARHFSIFRGQAYMDVTFRSLEMDSRHRAGTHEHSWPSSSPAMTATRARRKDVKIDEGQIIQEKHDYRGDIDGRFVRDRRGRAGGIDFFERSSRIRDWPGGQRGVYRGA